MELTAKQKQIGKYALYSIGGLLVLKLIFGKPKDAAVYDENGQVQDPTGNTTGNTTTEVFSASKKAADLLKAMDRLGTDEASIFKTLSGVSQAQFAEIRQAFGLRKYNGFSGLVLDPLNIYPAIPLERWLYHELSDTSYLTLKSKFPNYL